jgi:ferrous iron transport protein B
MTATLDAASPDAATTAPPANTAKRRLNVAIIGNPNVGKSTIFNAISGIRVRTGNYPGVTVDRKVGHCVFDGIEINLIDLPGTYSLAARSIDEQITVDVLRNGDPIAGPIDTIVYVLDSTKLERCLFLFTQLAEIGPPLVLALNMWDSAEAKGIHIDTQALRQRLNDTPVVPTVGHVRHGTDELRHEIGKSHNDADWKRFHEPFPWTRPGDESGSTAEDESHAMTADAQRRYAWAEEVAAVVASQTPPAGASWTARIDRVLTGRFTGTALFALLVLLVFQALYAWVTPLQDACEAAQGWVATIAAELVPPGPFQSLLVDGVIAGVGAVLVFVPQIALLFLVIAILEDCGYMARAAMMTDRLMSLFGISGKAFLPLMSSFACAVPGIMATRVIESRRERLMTILIAPLMSCSARLPVYLLLIAAFVPKVNLANGLVSVQGLVLLGMLSLGAIIAAPVAWVLSRTAFRGQPGSFVMELPDYKWPCPRTVTWRVYDRTRAFVVRAGTLIFAWTILIWAGGYFPADHTHIRELEAEIAALDERGAEVPDDLTVAYHHESQRLLEESLLGRFGHAIEPVVRPCGWDWRVGTAVIASFPAREVVISTMGTIFSLGGDVDEHDAGLRTALRSAAWTDGRPLLTLPSALGLMVFFALCAQCVSTLVIIGKETQSWRWPVISFVYMTGLAYLGAVLTFQLGSLLLT